MIFGTQNNRGDNRPNVNTQIFRSYSNDFMFSARAWNNQLSISFAPAVGKNGDGLTQYESEFKRIPSTALTGVNGTTLMEGINVTLLPAMREGKSASVTVPAGRDADRKMITVGYDADEKYAYVELAMNLDSTGKASDIMRHKFQKKEYLTSYDARTGSYADDVMVEGEFLQFIDIVDQIKFISGMIGHASKFETRNSSGSNAGNSYQGSSNSNTSKQENTSYAAPSATYTDMADFMPFS